MARLSPPPRHLLDGYERTSVVLVLSLILNRSQSWWKSYAVWHATCASIAEKNTKPTIRPSNGLMNNIASAFMPEGIAKTAGRIAASVMPMMTKLYLMNNSPVNDWRTIIKTPVFMFNPGRVQTHPKRRHRQVNLDPPHQTLNSIFGFFNKVREKSKFNLPMKTPA